MYYAKTSASASMYALIKKDGNLGWAPRSKATQFLNQEDAETRILIAALAIWAANKWHSIQFNHDRYFHPIEKLTPKTPDALARQIIRSSFSLEPTASSFKLDDGFDLHFVKSEHGWLGANTSRSAYTKFAWFESFADAKGFHSIDLACRTADDFHPCPRAILTSRCFFTQVARTPDCKDDTLLPLEAGLEARDLRAALDQASLAEAQGPEQTSKVARKARL